MNSEKYELKARALDGPLLPLIKQLNEIRRGNRAFHVLENVTFLDTANDALIAYAKQSRGNTVIAVVNLDPHQSQEGLAIVPASLSISANAALPAASLAPPVPSWAGKNILSRNQRWAEAQELVPVAV